MKIALGCDHGGFLLKEEIKKYLIENNYQVIDCGTDSLESCDYPIFARKASELVSNKTCEYGIVVCTTGEGVCMTANKTKGIRCALVYNQDVVKMTRLHNNANMIAIGAKYTSIEDALNYVNTFLNTGFEGGRHIKRVDLIEKN